MSYPLNTMFPDGLANYRAGDAIAVITTFPVNGRTEYGTLTRITVYDECPIVDYRTIDGRDVKTAPSAYDVFRLVRNLTNPTTKET